MFALVQRISKQENDNSVEQFLFHFHNSSVYCCYQYTCRKLSCVIPVIVQSREGVERNFQGWTACLPSPKSYGSVSVYDFHHTYYRHRCSVSTNSTCQRQTCRL